MNNKKEIIVPILVNSQEFEKIKNGNLNFVILKEKNNKDSRITRIKGNEKVKLMIIEINTGYKIYKKFYESCREVHSLARLTLDSNLIKYYILEWR